jgi:hypothetical protein
MVAGAALVSVPIIIHLINRMRFRRVKWAAMEFLLKAQKKMRRRKILEQLLLLFLRCLLVFLVGVLFSRFVGFDLQEKETRPTVHLVVLDDSPSMGDIGQGSGTSADTFAEAKKEIVEKIMPAAAEATSEQRLRILRLSDLSDIANEDGNKDPLKIDASAINRVKGDLGGLRPSPVRVSLVAGLKKARVLLNLSNADTAKVVHIISDLRSVEWTEEGEAIAQEIKDIQDAEGAKVHIVDVASPFRKLDRKTPAFSDNVGILELRPKHKVVAKDKEVDFEIRIKNFGSTDLKDVDIQFFKNGIGNDIPTVRIPTLPANQETKALFKARFSQTSTKDDPLARFNLVTAVLTNMGSDALAADNIRHAIVEVREKLAVLFVVNSEDKPDDKDSDSFYLRNLFNTKFAAIDVATAAPEGLEKLDLRQFSSIYLLNVPQLTKAQAESLERYVQDGGGVGFFLGPKVNPESYNEQLYKSGAGLFPVPLPSSFTPPLTAAEKEVWGRIGQVVILRDRSRKSHPAINGLYFDDQGRPTKQPIEGFLYSLHVHIDQHWPIARIGKWREDQTIQELYCLPNNRPMSAFEGQAVKLIDAIKSKYGEPKFEKYRATVDEMLQKIRTVSSESLPPSLLATYLDRLLADEFNEPEASDALMREFWANPELQDARKLAQALREACKYGDPLYLTRRVGNGRVTVMTIPVAAPWSDWPAGDKPDGWVAIVTEMQNYLSGGGADENRPVGSPFDPAFEAGRYKPSVNWAFLTTETPKGGKIPQNLALIREPEPGKEQNKFSLDNRGGKLFLNFNDARRPGAYFFTLTWQKKEGDPASSPSEKPEYLAEVFNIDTAHEGDLRRTNTDDFRSYAKGAELHSAEDVDWLERLKQKQTDLSSGRWLYLVILLVLIFEQAMAVRLSYHGRPDEVETFAPSVAAAFAHGTAPSASSAEVRTSDESLTA